MKACGWLMLAISVLACQPRQKQEQDVNPAPLSPIGVTSSGVNINYDRCGEGKIAILLVHGWSIDGTYWSSQMASLCRGYQVVAIDLPGHGLSGSNRRDWSVEKYGQDVAAVIDQLGLEQLILVGHSMGGDIILEAALQRPDQVLGLIGIDNFKDVGMVPEEETQAAIEGFFDMLQSHYQATVKEFAQQYLFSNQTDSLSRQRVMQSFTEADSTIAVKVLESLFAYGPKEIPQLKALGKKLYLINSDVTPTITTNLVANGIDFEVVDISGTGHYPMIEKPREFNRLLSETIDKILKE